MSFWLYMVQCNDGSYYVGHTEDLEVRLAEHASGIHGGYTATRLPIKLVWHDEFPTREEALERERQIKGWSRAKKRALIENDWDKISKLAKSKSPSSETKKSGYPSTGSG